MNHPINKRSLVKNSKKSRRNTSLLSKRPTVIFTQKYCIQGNLSAMFLRVVEAIVVAHRPLWHVWYCGTLHPLPGTISCSSIQQPSVCVNSSTSLDPSSWWAEYSLMLYLRWTHGFFLPLVPEWLSIKTIYMASPVLSIFYTQPREAWKHTEGRG